VSWSDEFRIGLAGSVHRVLTPRGIKIRQPVQLLREWYWLAVAVVPRTGQLEAQWMGSLDSDAFVPVLHDWQQAGIDLLVWDGLPGHRGVVHETGMLPTILQPVASPELNPTERIGEVIRDAMDGRLSATLWQEMLAVETVLHELQQDPARVQRLTGYPWILDALNQLPR
jgi:hypothetical protein